MPTGTVPQLASDATGHMLAEAVSEQQFIGWDNFMKGQISSKWKLAQQLYITALSKYTIKNFNYNLWASKLTTNI
eukprot:8437272-Ditylum_brightwellii.AAC.1